MHPWLDVGGALGLGTGACPATSEAGEFLVVNFDVITLFLWQAG